MAVQTFIVEIDYSCSPQAHSCGLLISYALLVFKGSGSFPRHHVPFLALLA